jgi:VIT1/CCC1 family predicted Fe2+/Mn2+ transporter
MDGVPTSQLAHHTSVDPHRRDRSLSAVILGGQDGIVNVLGVLLGVAAASGSSRVVLAAGLAAAFAESVSMAAVAYTSTLADSDLYRSELEREYRHVRDVPAIERAELREIYLRKGFQGELLDRVVETITRDPDVWVAIMMAEEHHLSPVERGQAFRAALVVGIASLVGSLLPLSPFPFVAVKPAAVASIGIAAAALFAVGIYKAKTTIGRPLRSGLELAAIGIASALVGWFIGAAFGVGGPL